MECPYCHGKIVEKARRCPFCGETLPRKGTGKREWIAFGFLTLLAALGVSWLLLEQGIFPERTVAEDVAPADGPVLLYPTGMPAAREQATATAPPVAIGEDAPDQGTAAKRTAPEEEAPAEGPDTVAPPQHSDRPLENAASAPQSTTEPAPSDAPIYRLTVEPLTAAIRVGEELTLRLTHNAPGTTVFLRNDRFGGDYGTYDQAYSQGDSGATFFLTGTAPGTTQLTFFYTAPDGTVVYSDPVIVDILPE